MVVSTQSNIPIAGMKDGVIILKTGHYRMVLEITAINFDLKSEQEKNSIIFQYQSFLNSLHFPIEIVVKSNKLDLSPYLKKIESLVPKQSNDLLRIQTQDYVDFVGQLINLANIMKKRFYVVVGYQPITMNTGIIDKLFKRNQDVSHIKISDTDFEHYSKELRQKAQTVAQGLGGMGLHCRQLNTQEIIEVFYEIYNPEVAGKERITGSEDISSSYVTQVAPNEALSNTNLNSASNQTVINSTDQIIDNQNIVIEQQKNSNIATAEETPAKPNENNETEPAVEPLPGEKTEETANQQPQGQTAVSPMSNQSQDDSYSSSNQNYGS